MTTQMDVNTKYSPSDWLLIQRKAFDKERLCRMNLLYDMAAMRDMAKQAVGSAPSPPKRAPAPPRPASNGTSRSASLIPSLVSSGRRLSSGSSGFGAARPQLDVLHPPAVQEVEKQVQHILERGAMARAGEQRRASTGAIDVGKTPLNRSPSDTGNSSFTRSFVMWPRGDDSNFMAAGDRAPSAA
eukprot:CAMPEP_0117530790 /NCGR_PEP_ID=MMETSP0784-20121206/38525_1 /TAXON_ID=39447 /ORGANISM="" /LENGTH=184 /DNA_ID=CAMNT_0005327145 /DNA_START=32 /DNA_END=587 /DNA_ORIENTATION=-